MKNSEGIKDDEDSFSEWGPLEINKTSIYITDKLSEYLKNNTSKPFLEFLKIENKSSEHIDSSLLENEIKSKLIKKKITFSLWKNIILISSCVCVSFLFIVCKGKSKFP